MAIPLLFYAALLVSGHSMASARDYGWLKQPISTNTEHSITGGSSSSAEHHANGAHITPHIIYIILSHTHPSVTMGSTKYYYESLSVLVFIL